jgi:hypothetical protein
MNEIMENVVETGVEVINEAVEVIEPVAKKGNGLKVVGGVAGIAIAAVALWNVGKWVVNKTKTKTEKVPDEIVDMDDDIEADEE